MEPEHTAEHITSRIGFSLDFTLRDEALGQLRARLLAAPIATSEALAAFTPSADKHQRRVIEASEQTIRIVAPAGSGKTQTIINRVLARIKEGAKPASILVLTFDNSAAGALRGKLKSELERLQGSGSDPDLGGLMISTLNAFGYSLVREHFPSDYLPVAPAREERAVVRDVLASLERLSPAHRAILPRNLQNRFYLEFFGLLKNELFDPRNLDVQRAADFVMARPQAAPFLEDAIESDENLRTAIEAVLWVFKATDGELRDRGYLDFDDQKLRAYVGLTSNRDVLRLLQSRLSEVIVDEFQDINRLDFELIKELAAGSTLVVTGDDDQAIYGFRGCSPEYIINLEQHLGRSVTSYELQVNYRCPPNIVEHADRLIRHNIWRIEKKPIAHQTTPSTISVLSSLSAGLEARMIVDFVRRLRKGRTDLSFADIAILYRTNAQSLPLQVEFVINELPYLVRDEDNLLENETLDRLLALLRTKIALSAGREPAEGDAVMAIRAYFRWLEPRELEAIRRALRGSSSFAAFVSSEQLHEALPKARSSRLADAVGSLRRAQGLIETIGVVGAEFHGMRGMIGSLEDAVDNQLPLGELKEVAANYGGTLQGFVDLMERVLTQARERGAGHNRQGIALLTYFRSKGRQWHSVILTSCNEGLIPHGRAPIEDERRLFYVAMTRASANLLVSYVANAVSLKVAPSRFLSEAGLLT